MKFKFQKTETSKNLAKIVGTEKIHGRFKVLGLAEKMTRGVKVSLKGEASRIFLDNEAAKGFIQSKLNSHECQLCDGGRVFLHINGEFDHSIDCPCCDGHGSISRDQFNKQTDFISAARKADAQVRLG